MVELRKLTVNDIDGAIRLSNAEKWNQTENDWKFIISNPENVCLAAVVNNLITGTAVAMNYDNKIAWIGMVLVDREFRGQGISKLLLTEILKELKGIPSVKLDATPAGQAVYQKFGFQNDCLIHRLTIASVSLEKLKHNDTLSENVATLSDHTAITRLEDKIFGADRSRLLNYLVSSFNNQAWVYMKGGIISGYALGRKGTRFYQIGPVNAETDEQAKALIVKVAESVINQPVVADVPEYNRNLIKFLSEGGFIEQRHFIRMYLNKNQQSDFYKHQRLVCGPEFG